MEPAWLLSWVGDGRREFASLDACMEELGGEFWRRICDRGRQAPEMIAELLPWLVGQRDREPGWIVTILAQACGKSPGHRETMTAAMHVIANAHPGEALASAGYHLHEHNILLDARWLERADRDYEANPEGAWGVVDAAAMYRTELVTPAIVEAFGPRRGAAPRDWFRTLFSVAAADPARRAGMVERALREFADFPGPAIEAAASAAGDVEELLTPELCDTVQRHVEANPEKGWEFFASAVRRLPALFTPARLDALTEIAATGPGQLMNVLNYIRDQEPDRGREMIDRLVPLMRRFPKEGIHAVYYGFQKAEKQLTPAIIGAVCEGFASEAYNAYSILGWLIEDRPDLLTPDVVRAAIGNIPHATNYAFGFFRHLLEKNPAWTAECTLALFECLALEPVNRAHVRKEEIDRILWISEAAHIRTGLEAALREPPKVGSRRARALMAILFRQASRSKRHVLIEALAHAAVSITWTDRNWTPLWDFLMFIIDNSPGEAVSTAAAEQFLENAFQLSHVAVTAREHDDFLAKLDLREVPDAAFPPEAAFLGDDRELAQLYRIVAALGARFGVESRFKPLERFMSRMQDEEIEAAALGPRIEQAKGDRRERMLERERALNRRAAWRLRPDYQRAFRSAEAEARLPAEAAEFMRQERRDLLRAMHDALRAEAIRIAVSSLDALRMELYRTRLKRELGEDRDYSNVEPRVLPALMFFRAVGGLRNNSKWLRQMILDRIEGKPHDWLRNEPEVVAWAEKIRAAIPGVRVDLWRAPFEKRVEYRKGDAVAERERRIASDLAQAAALLTKGGVAPAGGDFTSLRAQLEELKAPAPAEPQGESAPEDVRPRVAPEILEEVAMNLSRVEAALNVPESDFEGVLTFSVETDPFEVLYMGEYGFASCLSLRGANAWSAVSNAIDLDKAIIWAKDPGGNVVGRRLLALTERGILSFRTYTNRHGLTLDAAFSAFVAEYAARVGAPLATGGRGPGPLLSDRWYDDVAI